MLSFKPDTKLEKLLKALQGRMAETCTRLLSLADHERQYLNKCALISTIGASTRIENAVLTDIEIEWVDTTLSANGRTTSFEEKKSFILDKLSSDRERSIEEVVGCREVLNIVYQQATELFPLSEITLRGMHHELMQHFPPARHYAGKYKTVENRVVSTNHVTGQQVNVLEPTPPGIITDMAMQELVAWYNDTLREAPWPLLVATEFVFRFLAIHPFQDGNGRLGRALFLLALLQSNDQYLTAITPYIAIDRHIEQNKTHYYRVLNESADGKFQSDPRNYRYDALARFFISMTDSAISDIDIYRTRYSNLQRLSENALTILNVFKTSPEKRLKVTDIVLATNIPRRTIQYSLKTLTEKQFLQKLGSGPGSRYQLVF